MRILHKKAAPFFFLIFSMNKRHGMLECDKDTENPKHFYRTLSGSPWNWIYFAAPSIHSRRKKAQNWTHPHQNFTWLCPHLQYALAEEGEETHGPPPSWTWFKFPPRTRPRGVGPRHFYINSAIHRNSINLDNVQIIKTTIHATTQKQDFHSHSLTHYRFSLELKQPDL